MNPSEAKEVKAWQRAHQLAVEAYRRSGDIPEKNGLGLAADLRRAALAAPTRIARAAGGETTRERRSELRSAERAVRRLQYLALLARELGLLPPADADDLVLRATETLRTLRALSTDVIPPSAGGNDAPRPSSTTPIRSWTTFPQSGSEPTPRIDSRGRT